LAIAGNGLAREIRAGEMDGVAKFLKLAKEISTHIVKDVPKTPVRQDHAPCHQRPRLDERRPETCLLWAK